MSTLYIFYKKDKFNERVIIYANSYLEAKEALFALNNYADLIYDLNEFKCQHVNEEKMYEELKLNEEYEGYPYILTEENYKNIENSIIDKTYSNIHNTHLLTKKYANNLGMCDNSSNNNPLYTTEEFVSLLKEHSEEKKKTLNSIESMIKNIGDVWFAKYKSNVNTNYITAMYTDKYVYGHNRYEVINELKRLSEDNKNKIDNFDTYLLISSYPNISSNDIKRYKDFVTYIKNHNIKKLPFTT